MAHVSAASRVAAVRAVVLLVVAFALGVTALVLRPDPSAVATWWPAAGATCGVLLLSPRRWWPALVPAIAVVTFAANGLGGRPLGVGVGLGLTNAAEALAVGMVLHRLHRLDRHDPDARVPLRDTDDYLRLFLAAAAGALTFGAGAALTMAVLGQPVWETARTVTPSHLAATLVILPLLLIPACRPVDVRRRAELAVQAGLVAVALGATLSTSSSLAPLFVPLPLLVWAAVRFHPFVAAVEVFLVAAIATWATSHGLGPIALFSDRAGSHHLLAGANVQMYLICMALLTLPTALASAQRLELLRRIDLERQLSSTTLATTAAIIVVSDNRGVVQQVNEALERLTGFSAESAVGQRFWELPMVPVERRELVRAFFGPRDGSGVPELREADLVHRDGHRLRVVWNNNVVRDARGEMTHVVCTATDVTSELTSRQLVEHLFEAPMAAPMVSIDKDLVVTLVNRAGEDLLGVSADDVVGHHLDTLLSPRLAETLRRDLGQAARAAQRDALPGPPITRDWTWRRPDDGRTLTVSTTVSAVTDGAGEHVGYLVLARDVTAMRSIHEALVRALDTERDAVERLRRVDDAKNEFVSTVSHELRTPTTSIVGYTEMLRDGSAGEVSEEQGALLDVIARNGERLIAVANDLLVLAGLDSQDRTTWAEEPVDLGEVAQQAQQAIAPLIAGRSLQVSFDLPDRPLTVTGDPSHLDRVLVNLLSNAVKFTPDQGSIGCRLYRCGTRAVIEVSDTGIGIPEDEQADLFTKFFRSSNAQDRAIPGTGLGLSIIHRIVTEHGGDIMVRSAPHEGSTFTVRLPLAVRDARLASAG